MATSPPGVERLPHDRSHLLCHNREAQKPTERFKESIDRWRGAIVSDDSATDSRAGVPVRGTVFAKGDGTVAGRPPIERLVGRHFPSCEIEWFVSEGGKVSKPQKILALNGPSSSVLSCERILLNLLGRMSGIATATADWVEESGDIGIACTRKTAWGLMDKWAVHVGGGQALVGDVRLRGPQAQRPADRSLGRRVLPKEHPTKHRPRHVLLLG